MPTELLNRDVAVTAFSNLSYSPKKMKKKNKVSFIGVASNQGSTQDSAKTMQNVVKKNVIGSKPSGIEKKLHVLRQPMPDHSGATCTGLGLVRLKNCHRCYPSTMLLREVFKVSIPQTQNCSVGLGVALAQYEHPSDLINKNEHPSEVF